MDMDVVRDRIRQPRKGSKKVWHVPHPGEFVPGTVLCFDQTLTKTGWSLLVSSTLTLEVVRGGMLKPKVTDDFTSFRRTLEKAVQLEHSFEAVLRQFAMDPAVSIVHEMPSVAGYRVESSLGAAQSLHLAAERLGIRDRLVMINKQRAYARLVNVHPMSKAHVTATVNRLVARDMLNVTAWNQDVHDSVLLGLDHLYSGGN